jgi:hypothetical protein
MEPLLHGIAVRDEIVTAAQVLGTDVLIVDCMLGVGFAAATMLGLPTAVLVHVLYSGFAHGWGDQVMHSSVIDLLAPADLVLALTPPGFDAPIDVPANTEYVGPIWRPEPARAPTGSGDGLDMLTEPGDPWVLLSLSTTLQRQAEALPALLNAVARAPVRVLLTLGGVIPPNAVDAPSNTIVRAFVPHDLVLPHMSAVICHAGLSTITSSLAAGGATRLRPAGQGAATQCRARRGMRCRAGLARERGRRTDHRGHRLRSGRPRSPRRRAQARHSNLGARHGAARGRADRGPRHIRGRRPHPIVHRTTAGTPFPAAPNQDGQLER